MNTRYNVVLTAMQSPNIKDRRYEDVSKDDVLYILANNHNYDYLRANGFTMPSIERLDEYQELSSDFNIYICEYVPDVTCELYGIDYPDYFTGYGYMKEGFCVPLFQTRYTGAELSSLIQDEIDSIDYGFSNEQVSAIYDMCAKLDTELKDSLVIELDIDPDEDMIGYPNAYFIFND